MKVYWIKKQKGKKYESEKIIFEILKIDENRRWSITHTKNFWLAAFLDRDLGIDAEEPGRIVKASTANSLHARERKYLDALEAESREWREEFLRIWTAKESYSKLCGEGLKLGFKKFSVLDEVLEFADTVSMNGYPDGYMSFERGPGGLFVSAACSNHAEPLDFVRFDYDAPIETPALEKAAELLDKRNYTQAGLAKKLSGIGYSKSEAEGAASELASRGYIDDDAFSQRLFERYVDKGFGKLRIHREMTENGVPEDRIRELCASLDFEQGRALEQAQKIYKGGADSREAAAKEKARIMRRLAYLGYESSAVYGAVEQLIKGAK